MISNFTYLPTQFPEFIKSYKSSEIKRLKREFKFDMLGGQDREQAMKNIRQLIKSGVAQRKEIVESDPLKYYVPTGDNEKIIECLDYCRNAGNDVATIGNFAGNGTGKTETLVNVCLNILIPQYNKYWFGKYEFYRNPKFKHPNIWYCSSSEALRKGEAVDSTLHKYLDPLGYGDLIKYKSGNILASLKLPTSKYTITFKTYGQDKTAFESGNVAMIIFDEPSNTMLYNASKGRARGGLITLMNFTPLECPQEMLEDIDKGMKDPKQYVWKFTSSLWGTSITKGIRGFYTDEQILESINKYAPEERDARVKGLPLYYVGMVYKNFDDSKHTQLITEEDFEAHVNGERLWYMPDKNATFIYAEDPADAKPQFGMWTAVNSNGRIIHMVEVPHHDGRPYWEMKKGVSIDQHFMDIARIEDDLGEKLGLDTILPIKRRILDYHFGTQQRGSQENLFDKYVRESKARGLKGRWVESYKSRQNQSELKYGHSVVRNNLDAYLPDGHPKVVFWSTCPHAIQSMQTYSYKVKLGDGMSFGNQVIEKGKDGADVKRYTDCDRLIDRPSRYKDDFIPHKDEVINYRKII